jgi:hypothetical protein
MHPTIHYDLANARIADLHRQAQPDALARTARRAPHASTAAQPSPAQVPGGCGAGRSPR